MLQINRGGRHILTEEKLYKAIEHMNSVVCETEFYMLRKA